MSTFTLLGGPGDISTVGGDVKIDGGREEGWGVKAAPEDEACGAVALTASSRFEAWTGVVGIVSGGS